MISSQPHNLSPRSKVSHEKQGGDAGRSPAIVGVTCFEEIVSATRPNPVSAPEQLARPSKGRLPRFVVIDCQITGVSPDRHEIIQIVAARLNADGSIGAQFSTYVRPRNRVPRTVTTLTGISDADVADAPTAPEALRTLARFVEEAAADRADEPMIVALTGHMPFIAAACARHALPLRRVRVIDSRIFYSDFLATFFVKYPDAPELSDLVDLTGMAISTVMADPIDVVSDIEDWLGIDATGLPYPRHEGADVRVRLFASTVRHVIYGLSSDADAKNLQAKAQDYDFISTE